jgi:ankyrin repeat protein
MVAHVNSMGVENKTALHCAVLEGKTEVVALLLKFRAIPDAKTIHERTPLHLACILGEFEISKLLIDAGASLVIQDYEMNTPIHYASQYSTLFQYNCRTY